jgi:hypothetical protein
MPRWIEVSPPGGGFSVSMPTPPREDTLTQDPLVSHVFEAETGSGEVAFAVTYTDYGEGPLAGDPEKRLDDARDARVAGAGGKVVFERRMAVGDLPARELRIDSPAQVIDARIVVRGARLYEVSVTVQTGSARPDDDERRFFESFVLSPERGSGGEAPGSTALSGGSGGEALGRTLSPSPRRTPDGRRPGSRRRSSRADRP